LKIERAEGLLGGKSLFKSHNDGTIDKTKVVCSICKAEVSYYRSSWSLSYRLNAKHPTESSPRLDDRQPTLHDFSRKITRPVREKVAIWFAGDCRPINIVDDSGLIEVIRIASGEILMIYRRGAPLCLAYMPCMRAREHEKNTIKQQCLKHTLSEVITRSFIRFSLEKKTTFYSRVIYRVSY